MVTVLLKLMCYYPFYNSLLVKNDVLFIERDRMRQKHKELSKYVVTIKKQLDTIIKGLEKAALYAYVLF